MSMSQEEIESLMNGLDFKDDDSSSESDEKKAEPQGNMSEDDINELIAQTEDIVKNEDKKVEDESVEDILNNLENIEKEEDKPSEETNIDDIIKELENSQNEEKSSENQEKEEPKEEKPSENTEEQNESLEEAKEEPTIEETIAQSNEKLSSDNIDEILSSIEGIEEEKVPEPSIDYEEKRGDDLDSKIDSGVFPLPVEEDTKVVNQLSAVANDSEEKATKIFDVLSNILDYNNAIQNDVKILNDFSEKQVAMLSSLSQKFPNIEVFKKNLEAAKEMSTHISDVNEKINDGNAEIFQAMELMQFHDINRQKIERVMAVIRKLTIYLNNLFEDQGDHKEIAVAKHIAGDTNTDDLMANDDLEALIAEFNK
ncbi:hypothetical protein [Halarcobacter anaerophilus]|uniref:Chemotaxis protein n=2 Tax=Halarcobacter anaerophilus TaxID=877500 RepID=A0A4Q0XYS0_9BACT|nr:hypothetical protein [Halarcobacter anaerophilus]QDF29864.1 hypothetical protein AANAER_2407 [Halarcobacter anaerophilus]RXJ62826.1 hypothetical protein CRV06_08305 [Halarcobacter anaerophilus]